MPITIATTQTFTDAELLVLYRNCLAQIAVNQSYSIGGRQFSRADLQDVREMIEWLEARVEVATTDNGGIALAQFGDPV